MTAVLERNCLSTVQSNLIINSVGSNRFYIMPDFHNTLPMFTDNKSYTEESHWIQIINSIADLHNWTDLFKLEIVHTKQNGSSHDWYMGRLFTDWILVTIQIYKEDKKSKPKLFN